VYHLKLLQGEAVSHPLTEMMEPIHRYVQHKSKAQLLGQSLREGVSMAPVSTTEELARFRYLEGRSYWLNASFPNGREVLVPALLARSSETPMNIRRCTPRLREHNDEVLGGLLGLSAGLIAEAKANF